MKKCQICWLDEYQLKVDNKGYKIYIGETKNYFSFYTNKKINVCNICDKEVENHHNKNYKRL